MKFFNGRIWVLSAVVIDRVRLYSFYGGAEDSSGCSVCDIFCEIAVRSDCETTSEALPEKGIRGTRVSKLSVKRQEKGKSGLMVEELRQA